MSVPVLGPFAVVTFRFSPFAVVDGRVPVVYYFLSMESKPNDDIADIVERFRIALGLKPWEEWADQITAALMRSSGITNTQHRRTGRTQFGILQALAKCIQVGASVLSIQADPELNRRYCIDMARENISKLGLDIRVTRDFPGCSNGDLAVLYVDHHIPTRAR